MGLITRSEASHRLRLIASKVNLAVTAARDGNWEEAADCAAEAQTLLEVITPHLEEAANDPTLAAAAEHSGGGMGYRGSTHNDPLSDRNARESLENWKRQHSPQPQRRSDPDNGSKSNGPRVKPPEPINIPKPIVTPPPEPPKRTAPPKPIIITPPPPPPPAPEPEIPEGAEVVTLDIDRLLHGVLDAEEQGKLTLFMDLAAPFRKEVLMYHTKTRKPVTLWRTDANWNISK